jgi:hypothetical protein
MIEWQKGMRNTVGHNPKYYSEFRASNRIIRLLDTISDKERMEVFAEYCTHCGDKNPKCQCWNDE